MKLTRTFSFISLFIIVVIILYFSTYFIEQKRIERQDEAANSMLREKIYVLFPPTVAVKLRDLGLKCSVEDIATVIRNGVPDDFNRTQIALRILGLNNNVDLSGGGTFDVYSHFSLRDVNDSVVFETIKRLSDDELGKKGAFRWLLRNNALPNMEPNERAVLLSELVPIVLSTKYRWNQCFVIKQLEKFGDNASILLLNQVLEGKIALADPNEKVDPMLFLPGFTAKDRCSARALAALALANLGQKQTLPKITELAINASGDDKVVYDMALGLMQNSIMPKDEINSNPALNRIYDHF